MPRCREALEARIASATTFAAWAAARRSGGPCILLHAASAGELRQAEPLIRRFRTSHPEWHLAVTYTSRSAVAVATDLPLDVHGFLPWDTPTSTSALLEALRPALMVVSKLDLWPELAHQAVRRGVPVVLVGAMV
ncbi:MAG TPA: glycosyltransferase N-terminal domain-containing protein, partial [Gemmatimonadales bacterium]|nr:glycosyltransferase N-terminal domain-containing protein [Gemmatimonadales bacterium]